MEEKKLYNAVRKIITLADGRQIEIETGKLAKQADGSVVVKMGDTMLLGTVVAAKDAKPDTDFMPLQVEYKEKYAAVGRFPGGFMKREARANDSEVLVARLIDRALRPLFPADYHAEVYVTVNLISADKDIQPDALAGLAASAALAVSDIPFGGPISEVRVVRRNGEYAINPTYSEMPECDLDIMVGGTIDNILMVEGEMKEVSEEVMLGAIKFAHEEIKKHCAVQIELSKELGKDVKRTYCHEVNDEELRQTIIRELYDKAYAIATSGTMKHEREDKFNALEAEFAARYSEEELIEIPADRIWQEFFLADFHIPAEKLAGLGEDLCYMFDRWRKHIVKREGLEETLKGLKDAGYRLGVISNIMSTTFVPRILEEHGVRQYFETLTMSSVCGIRKPRADIFDIALKEMGIPKEEAAYVGDTISRDVRGISNAGWPLMIQIDNPRIYHKDEKYRGMGYKADVEIKTLAEILPAVEEFNRKLKEGT